MIQRVVRNTGATLRHTFYVDGVATAPTGTVTVTVAKADGTTLVSGNATVATTEASYVLAPQTTLNNLTVTWAGTVSAVARTEVDYVEIVGARYLTDQELTSLRDIAGQAHKFTFDDLREKLTEFEDIAEEYCGVAFVRRYARDLLDGSGVSRVYVSRRPARSLLSVHVAGSSYSTSLFTLYTHGVLDYLTGSFTSPTVSGLNIAVGYEHGLDRPPPKIVHAAKQWIRSTLFADRSGVGRDVLSITDTQTGGSTRYSTPDWDAGRPTGFLEVDRDLNASMFRPRKRAYSVGMGLPEVSVPSVNL